MNHSIQPATPDQMDEVRALIEEYAASLSIDLCFQDLHRELGELPGDYDPILLLSDLGGCVALRPLTPTIAEMKRLYVRPSHRGQGLGHRLAAAIIECARERGYKAVRLDTLPEMREAISLYRRMGFREIEPYRRYSVPGLLFMELTL